jgi:hypothetical protein
MGDYEKAIENHSKALDIFLKQHRESSILDIAVSYNNIGSAYEIKGDY